MLDQWTDAAGQGEQAARSAGLGGSDPRTQALYTRAMPGGGSVRVELLVSDLSDAGDARRRGRVIIEPREPSAARPESTPLVVEELEGDDENAVVAELFRIARDNAAIARRVLRKRAERAD